MEEIEAKPEEILEEQPKAGFLNKIKIHKFKILGGALGFFVFAGAVFGAYKFGQRQVKPGSQPTPTQGVTCSPCPQFMPPHPDFCKDGTIIPGEKDECGCQMPPRCQRSTADWETYSGKYFSIKYPQNWELPKEPLPVDENVLELFTLTSTKPKIILFTIQVLSARGAKNLDESQYVKLRRETKEYIESSYWLDNEAAIFFTKDEPSFLGYSVFALRKERIYYLGFASSETDHSGEQSKEEFSDTFDLMLSTFRFLPSAGSGQGE